MVEWLFNAVIFQVAGGIIVYLMMNCTRVLICRGIIMIFWRSLTKEEFEVKTTCTRSGEILLESANFWDRKVSKEEERSEDGEQVRVQKVQSNGDVGHENNNNDNDNSQSKDEEEDRVEDGVRYERNNEDKREHSLRVRTARSMKEINDRLEKMLKWMVIRGRMYTIFGLALNVVWLVVLMKVQKSISYNPAA